MMDHPHQGGSIIEFGPGRSRISTLRHIDLSRLLIPGGAMRCDHAAGRATRASPQPASRLR
jgi:hypothetical protein